MATQGLVSICEQPAGQETVRCVVMKLVAGCDGYNAPKVAEKLRAAWPVDPESAYNIALREGFGCVNDLVVITRDAVFTELEALDPRYRDTFLDANFNPRWAIGTAEFTEIVNV